MNSNGQQRRNFSHSSYYGQPPEQYLQFAFENFSQYLNPESEKARQTLMIHYQKEQKSDRRFANSFKTVMCENWLKRGQCSIGRHCRFAHGFDDIRPARIPPPINSKYKTRPCEKYRRGVCPYGQRCLYIHPERDNTNNNNSSMAPSSPSIEQQQSPPPIRWTPQSADEWANHHPPAPPPTPNPHYHSPTMMAIPSPFETASSIIPLMDNNNPSSSSFAYSFPMAMGVQPTMRTMLANTQNNQQRMKTMPNKRPNLFPQIFEELQREKANSTPTTSTTQTTQSHHRGKKWSDSDKENSPPPPPPPTSSQTTKKWSDLEPPEEMGNNDHQREMERIVEQLVASPMMMPKQDYNYIFGRMDE